METKEALKRLCPSKLSISVPIQRNLLKGKQDNQRNCEADRCMAWDEYRGYCQLIQRDHPFDTFEEGTGEDLTEDVF